MSYLNPLSSIYQQQVSLAGSQGAGYLVRKIYVSRRVNQIQQVVMAEVIIDERCRICLQINATTINSIPNPQILSFTMITPSSHYVIFHCKSFGPCSRHLDCDASVPLDLQLVQELCLANYAVSASFVNPIRKCRFTMIYVGYDTEVADAICWYFRNCCRDVGRRGHSA